VWLRRLLGISAEAATERFQSELGVEDMPPGIALVQTVTTGADGVPYEVLEHRRGTTLRAVSEAQLLDIDRAARIALACAQVVAELHERGRVHGELAPERVVFDPDGTHLEVVLLGGGHHRARRADRTIAFPDGDDLWLAPEVRKGRIPDARSDVFGLGAILFYAATGQPLPRRRGETLSVPMVSCHRPDIQGDVKADPRWRLIEPIDRVLEKCLERSPERRFPSSKDVVSALAACLEGSSDEETLLLP
jgi:serine/threonine-protein kinase